MWTEQQLAEYHERGFLAQPGLLSADELAELQQTSADMVARYEKHTELAGDDDNEVHFVRETSGAVRSIFATHRKVEAYRRAIRHSKIAGPLKQVFDNDAYVFHSKVNVKDAFEGAVWLWHQDYGYWQFDGVNDRMLSVLIMLDETTVHGGCLLFVPGSHKWGVLDHYSDEVTTNYKQWVVTPEALRKHLTVDCEIVPVVGKPGDVYFFDCKILHGSGHNMSPQARKTLIFACADMANKPQPVEKPRPYWVVERQFESVTDGVAVGAG